MLPWPPGVVQWQTHDYVRHGATRLRTALDITTDEVIGQFHRCYCGQEFLMFLRKINARIPVDMDVRLIMDNYGTHKTPKLGGCLGRHPRLYVHFTPTSASRINQMERSFSTPTEKFVRRNTDRSTQALDRSGPYETICKSTMPIRNRSYGSSQLTISCPASRELSAHF